MLEHPAISNAALGVSAVSAVTAWAEPLDFWIRVVAGLVAIAAGMFSIYTNARK